MYAFFCGGGGGVDVFFVCVNTNFDIYAVVVVLNFKNEISPPMLAGVLGVGVHGGNRDAILHRSNLVRVQP